MHWVRISRKESPGTVNTLLVMSPWGVAGGYSGPIVLQDRLLSAVSKKCDLQSTVLYRDRRLARNPFWVHKPVPIVTTPSESFSTLQKFVWTLRTSLYALTHRRRFDAVFLQGTYMLNCIPALFLSRRTKLIVLPVVEGGDLAKPNGGIKQFVKRRIQSRLFKRFVLGISLSSAIRSDLQRLGVPFSRTCVSYNLVDSKDYRPKSSVTEVESEEFKIIFVGMLGRRKQAHLVVEACALLRNAGIPAIATFVGPDESAEYAACFDAVVRRCRLEAEVHKVGLSNVLIPYYQQSDVFMLPSLSEGMPGALSEAMSCGLPVVTSPVGAMQEVVSAAECGLVIHGSSAKEWAAALEKLYRSPELSRSMGENGKQFAARHMSPEILASQICQKVWSVG